MTENRQETRYWSSGPIRTFFFTAIERTRTCSKSKFYLETMRRKVLSRSTKEGGMNIAFNADIPTYRQQARAFQLSLSLSLSLSPCPLSLVPCPCPVRSTPAETKFNCAHAKGLFFIRWKPSVRTRNEINDSVSRISPLSARARVSGDERRWACTYIDRRGTTSVLYTENETFGNVTVDFLNLREIPRSWTSGS